MDNKRTIRIFTSYAHDDVIVATKLMKLLDTNFGTSSRFLIERWSDEDLVIGSNWNQTIQSSANKAEFGLLLVSPAFLASTYIKDIELTKYINENGDLLGGHKILPIALAPVDLSHMNLHGLQHRQIFYHNKRSFLECRDRIQRHAFALALFKEIEHAIGV